MTIIDLDPALSAASEGPFCAACGGRTRLVGIEAHPRLPRTDIRTYECIGCEAMQAAVAPHPTRSINAMVVIGAGAPFA
jgi:hypothetical protein